MLLDDNEKMVEIFIDNLLWGNLKFNPDIVEGGWSDGSKLSEVVQEIGLWCKLRREHKQDTEEYKKTTDSIGTNFVVGRLFGALNGIMEDRDLNKELENIRDDNHKLTALVSQAYIPSKDEKVGTN